MSAGLALLPFAFSLESVGDIVPSWRLIAALAYLTLLGSVLAYLLWFHLLRVSGATAASSYHFMMPPLGMLFGWLLLGEHLAVTDLVGIVPVAIGIYLVTRPTPSPGETRRARAQ
jgi:drug/metabolite transporter (DMT)-like permease